MQLKHKLGTRCCSVSASGAKANKDHHGRHADHSSLSGLGTWGHLGSRRGIASGSCFMTPWNEKQQTEGGPAGILFQLLMAFVYFKGPPPPHPNKNHLGKNRCRSCCFSKMLGPTSPNPITFRTSVCSQWYMTTETPKNKHMAPLFFFASLFQASCGYRSGTAPAWSAWLLGIFLCMGSWGFETSYSPQQKHPNHLK